MNVTRCPKCDTKCDLSEGNLYLGTLVECPACGCRFEHIGKTPQNTRVTSASPGFRVSPKPGVEQAATNKTTHKTRTVRPSPQKTEPKFAWKRFLILIVAWSVLSFYFSVSTISFLFPASLILMAFFRTNRPVFKTANRKNFAYFSFDKGVEISSALTIVVAFYVVASWLFDGSNDQSTLGYLWELEDRFMSFKKLVSGYLIFKPWISALLIALLIVVDLVYTYVVGFDASAESDGKEKPKSLVARYLAFQRLSKRAYIVLTLLCAFTFFGNAVVGEKIARVQVRIGKIRSGYEEARKATEQALTAEVQQRLLDEIDHSVAYHRPYRAGDQKYYHDIVYTSHDRVESLRKSYSTATSTANVVLEPKLEARVKKVTSKPPPPYNGPREVAYSDSGAGGATETSPQAESRPANLKELTVEKVEEVNKSFQNTSKLRRSISAIKLADGTEILVQLPKSFTNVAKGVAFSELTARFPFLEPMIYGLVSAFDKTVEERVKTKVGPMLDRLLAKWFPGDMVSPAGFENEAEKIVNESKITVSETVIKETRTAASEYMNAIAESNGLISELDSRTEIARARNQPPPSEVVRNQRSLPDVDMLPEATCSATARKNFEIRLARAKSWEERVQAARIYQSDLERLGESGGFGLPTLRPSEPGGFGLPRSRPSERGRFGIPALKPG